MKENDEDSFNESENENHEIEDKIEDKKDNHIKNKIEQKKGNKKENKKDNIKGNKRANHIEEEAPKKIKVILLGESHVGKTCLLNAFINQKFNDHSLATINYSFVNKTIKIDNKEYDIHLWDTAGQERFRCISKLYIKGAQIVIFVFDITEKRTFKELSFWVKYVEELINDDIVKGMAANKIDLLFEEENKCNEVNKEEAKEYANQIGAMFQETSAKEDQKGFISFVKHLVKQYIDKTKDKEVILDAYTLRHANKGKAKRKFC